MDLHLFATTGSALASLLQTAANCSEGFGLLVGTNALLDCHTAALNALKVVFLGRHGDTKKHKVTAGHTW